MPSRARDDNRVIYEPAIFDKACHQQTKQSLKLSDELAAVVKERLSTGERLNIKKSSPTAFKDIPKRLYSRKLFRIADVRKHRFRLPHSTNAGRSDL